ncbi:MAG: hypothetical protein LBD21_04280 [Tannerellaceae bacterium]|nr:hypothetical protein [Tannerellaceae bacterium]
MQGDIWGAIAAVTAVIITGIISFFITRWQVRKENKNTLCQMERQYENVLRQLRAETEVLKYRRLNAQKLDALQRCWGLLIYTTNAENEKSILTYKVVVLRNEKDQTKVEKTEYFFNRELICEFINRLYEFYYKEGWGMYLSDELKELLFQYEFKIDGLKRPEDDNDNTESIVKFKSKSIARFLITLHEQIAEKLQKEMLEFYATATDENNTLKRQEDAL